MNDPQKGILGPPSKYHAKHVVVWYLVQCSIYSPAEYPTKWKGWWRDLDGLWTSLVGSSRKFVGYLVQSLDHFALHMHPWG